MVDVVTQQAAEAQSAEAVQAEDTTAAEEMAQVAQEAAVQNKPAEEELSSEQQAWDDILEDDEDTPEELTAEVPAKEEPKPEESEEEKPSEETPPEEVKPVEPEVPAEEVKVSPVVAPPEDTRTPEEVTAEVTKAREDARANLVESYKMTEEQVEQFEEDPSVALSNLAADLFLDLYDSISQGLRGQMPGMVNGIMAQQAAVTANENAFFGAWPQLAKPEYRETVDRIASAYRQQNPTTDNTTAVTEIGAQAWVALKLPLDQLVAHTQGETTEIVTPELPIPTHVPASAGNAPHSARAPVKQARNEFEQLADELLLDDE